GPPHRHTLFPYTALFRSELVDQHGAPPVDLLGQEAVERGRLAGAEEAGEDGEGDRGGLVAHGVGVTGMRISRRAAPPPWPAARPSEPPTGSSTRRARCSSALRSRSPDTSDTWMSATSPAPSDSRRVRTQTAPPPARAASAASPSSVASSRTSSPGTTRTGGSAPVSIDTSQSS